MSHEQKVLQLLGLDSSALVNGANAADNLLALKKTIEAASGAPSPSLRAPTFSALLGANTVENIEIEQWLSFSRTTELKAESLLGLNNFLGKRSYLAGQRPSLADVDLYAAFSDKLELLSAEAAPHLCRWLDHIQHLLGVERKKAFSFSLLSVPVPNLSEPTPTSAIAPAPSTVPASAPKKEEAKVEADEEQGKQVEGKKEKGEGKKGKTEKEAKPAAAEKKADEASATADLDPNKLDIRVGLVRRCWNHEGSEKLLCEEIDLGEESGPRSIASGIRLFYKAEEVQGRKVLVLANLKERSIAGFKSQGMVLCASTPDHSHVALVEVPADAKVGDRVLFQGFAESEPATPAQMVKKKIFEGLAPGLCTDSEGVAKWKDAAFTINGQVCKAPLSLATVS